MALTRGARMVLVFITLAVIVSMTGLTLGYYLVRRGPSITSESVLWLRVPAVLSERAPDDLFSLLSGDGGATVGSIVGRATEGKGG